MILIDENGSRLDMTLGQAKELARSQGKTLLQVANDVFKICDAGKIKYERKQKEKRLNEQKRAQKIKEVRIGPNIDMGDLETKSNQIKSFLLGGLKTKIVMRVKKYQPQLKAIGVEKINGIIKFLIDNKIAVVEKSITTDGSLVFAILSPTKK